MSIGNSKWTRTHWAGALIAALALVVGSHCATQPTSEVLSSNSDVAESDSDAAGQDVPGDTATADGVPAADASTSASSRCAPFSKSVQTGTLEAAQIDEASGLAASWKYPGLLWTHNDSGDEARAFLIRADGALVAEVKFDGVEAVDWEDIATGPCAEDAEQSCVYVADTGDNLKQRESSVVYRFAEPDLPPGHLKVSPEPQAPVVLSISAIQQIWLTYTEGPRDVETLMVHPNTAAVYLVEKNETPHAPVFEIPPAEAPPEQPARATRVGLLHLPGLAGLLAMVTGGDISPDGREFTIRTYLEAFTYCASGDHPEAFEELFSVAPVRRGMPLMVQSEALAYDRDGQSLWVTSEGAHAPIYRVSRPRSDAAE